MIGRRVLRQVAENRTVKIFVRLRINDRRVYGLYGVIGRERVNDNDSQHLSSREVDRYVGIIYRDLSENARTMVLSKLSNVLQISSIYSSWSGCSADHVYFCQNSSREYVLRYQRYTNANAWTPRTHEGTRVSRVPNFSFMHNWLDVRGDSTENRFPVNGLRPIWMFRHLFDCTFCNFLTVLMYCKIIICKNLLSAAWNRAKSIFPVTRLTCTTLQINYKLYNIYNICIDGARVRAL